MDGEEHIQQVPVGDDVRVKVDLHHFGVSCISIADCAIGGIIHVPACVSGFDALHTLDLIKNSFETPETPPSQCGSLKIIVHMITPFLNFLTPNRQRGNAKTY